MMMMVILNYKADLIVRQRDCSARCVEEQASAEEERRSLLSSCLSVAFLFPDVLASLPVPLLTFTCISREQRVRQELWRDLLVQEISSRFGGQKGITITIITIRKRGTLADPTRATEGTVSPRETESALESLIR